MAPFPDSVAWLARLPEVAATLAGAWRLTMDGAPRGGHLSAVWPVRDSRGRPLALKVAFPEPATLDEVTALRAFDGRGVVRCLAHDLERNALLLERLDAARCLQDYPDIDEACELVAALLARLHDPSVGADRPVRSIAQEANRIATGIRERAPATPGLVPRRAVDRALETLATLPGIGRQSLLHNDCHFLNVLHTRPGAAEPGWRAIDPLPMLGPLEWEPIPVLRNRWEDAVATGDPDRALRRRVDQITGALGADAGLARRLAQAVAVDNLLWLLPRDPGSMFVPPYSVIAAWG